MAFWAFCLGYLISSMIQVFVTEERMQRTMGRAGPRSMALATFFGFVSSSCSFAALSTTRALFQKGAGLAPALAFLLASTNLVIELGILIYLFLSWQFVVGEYLGGLLLIAITWLLVALTLPAELEEQARAHAGEAAGGDAGEAPPDWRRLMRSLEGWHRVGRRYGMEWSMVWKDVVFGFSVAGIIAAFVPDAFFRSLFVGSGTEAGPTALEIVAHTLIGPLAAFFTFIGSMGNIPLASILFGSGVSFAGVMAFIFSDLVVFPVLRISAGYFGWKMAAYILSVFLASLVATSLMLHLGFSLLGWMPDPASARVAQTTPGERFAVDYTLALNLLFLVLSAGLSGLARFGAPEEEGEAGEEDEESGKGEADGEARSRGVSILFALALLSLVWLAGGVVLSAVL